MIELRIDSDGTVTDLATGLKMTFEQIMEASDLLTIEAAKQNPGEFKKKLRFVLRDASQQEFNYQIDESFGYSDLETALLKTIVDFGRFNHFDNGTIPRVYLYKNLYVTNGTIDKLVDNPHTISFLKETYAITIGAKSETANERNG